MRRIIKHLVWIWYILESLAHVGKLLMCLIYICAFLDYSFRMRGRY